MNKLLCVALFAFLLTSCGSNSAEQPVEEEDTTAAEELTYMWEARLNDSTGQLELKQFLSEGTDGSSPQSVTGYINTINPEIKLDFLKLSQDTAYLKIDDAHYLTQQMGSSGPAVYLSSLVYNFTEIPGIRYVNIQFEAGDHAQPGTYNRNSFSGE